MGSFGKGFSLALVLAFSAILIFNVFFPPQNEVKKNNLQDKAKQQLEITDKHQQISEEMLNKSIEQQKRYDELLTKWEQQAEKIDNIISKKIGNNR